MLAYEDANMRIWENEVNSKVLDIWYMYNIIVYAIELVSILGLCIVKLKHHSVKSYLIFSSILISYTHKFTGIVNILLPTEVLLHFYLS